MKSRAAEFMAVEECAVIITEWRASHVYFVSLTITATVSVYGGVMWGEHRTDDDYALGR